MSRLPNKFQNSTEQQKLLAIAVQLNSHNSNQGPSAPNGCKGNVCRICGGSRSYLKSKIWCAPIQTLTSVGRIRVANLHPLKGRLRMGVPVKLALSDQLLWLKQFIIK